MQPTAEEKVRERRLRRAAQRKGLKLRKSKLLDPHHPEFGLWWVILPPVRYPEEWRNLGRELTPRDGVTLEQAAAFVEGYRPQRVSPDVSGLLGSNSDEVSIG